VKYVMHVRDSATTDKRFFEFDPTLDSRARIYITPDCGMVEVPESAVPCPVIFEDLGLPAVTGGIEVSILAELMPALELALASCSGIKVSILAELMPALELALASCSDLSYEEAALISTFSKMLTVLEKTHDERKAAHLVAARAHLKAVPALAAVPEVAKVCLLPCSVLSPSIFTTLLLQLRVAS
jgi:hypothetical protein